MGCTQWSTRCKSQLHATQEPTATPVILTFAVSRRSPFCGGRDRLDVVIFNRSAAYSGDNWPGRAMSAFLSSIPCKTSSVRRAISCNAPAWVRIPSPPGVNLNTGSLRSISVARYSRSLFICHISSRIASLEGRLLVFNAVS